MQRVDALEALLQVRLHAQRVLVRVRVTVRVTVRVRVRVRVRVSVRVRVRGHGVRHGRVVHAQALHRSVEQVEALLGDGGGDGGAHAARLRALVQDGHLV